MVPELLRYYESALTSPGTQTTSDTLICLRPKPLNLAPLPPRPFDRFHNRFCIFTAHFGDRETSTGHPHWLQCACLTLHVMSLIPRCRGRQGCLTFVLGVSLRTSVLGSAESAASPTHPAVPAFSISLSTCTSQIGASRLSPSPPPRPSRKRPRSILCCADHCAALA